MMNDFAIEAAARCIWERRVAPMIGFRKTWDTEAECYKQDFRDDAAAMLKAAGYVMESPN